MMKQNMNNLKKQIIYRCSYSGTKESDLLYKKTFLRKIDNLTNSDLNQILNLFANLSDLEIINILTSKKKPPENFKQLFQKIMNV